MSIVLLLFFGDGLVLLMIFMKLGGLFWWFVFIVWLLVEDRKNRFVLVSNEIVFLGNGSDDEISCGEGR